MCDYDVKDIMTQNVFVVHIISKLSSLKELTLVITRSSIQLGSLSSGSLLRL